VRLSVWNLGLTGPFSISWLTNKWLWNIGGLIGYGKSRRIRRETSPNAILSTTDGTQTTLSADLELHSETSVAYRLSYGTATIALLNITSNTRFIC
jgi:hypothetical protein